MRSRRPLLSHHLTESSRTSSWLRAHTLQMIRSLDEHSSSPLASPNRIYHSALSTSSQEDESAPASGVQHNQIHMELDFTYTADTPTARAFRELRSQNETLRESMNSLNENVKTARNLAHAQMAQILSLQHELCALEGKLKSAYSAGQDSVCARV
jgi:hypothetical protein